MKNFMTLYESKFRLVVQTSPNCCWSSERGGWARSLLYWWWYTSTFGKRLTGPREVIMSSAVSHLLESRVVQLLTLCSAWRPRRTTTSYFPLYWSNCSALQVDLFTAIISSATLQRAMRTQSKTLFSNHHIFHTTMLLWFINCGRIDSRFPFSLHFVILLGLISLFHRSVFLGWNKKYVY